MIDVPDLEFDSFGFEHYYGAEDWEDLNMTFLPNRFPFTGPTPGPVCHIRRRPVPLQDFFAPYWLDKTLKLICEHTNQYARQPQYSNPSKLNGGPNWEDVTPQEIHLWFGVYMYMGLKKLPNNRLYWDKRKLFGCSIGLKVVKSLVSDLKRLGHEVVIDRFSVLFNCLMNCSSSFFCYGDGETEPTWYASRFSVLLACRWEMWWGHSEDAPFSAHVRHCLV